MSDCRKCVDFDWCVEHEDCELFNPKPQTNYDMIIGKTPEELAGWLSAIDNSHRPVYARKDSKEWLEWLKQEATDG